jgi:hypothetical protein
MANLEPLQSAGVDIDSFPAGKREALEHLTDEEIAALAAIKTKLTADPSFSNGMGNILW